MAILYQAGLVEARKEGRWNYYRLADEDAHEYILEAIKWIQKATLKDKQIVADAKQVKAVCKMDRDKLCACYKNPIRTKSTTKYR